MTRPLPAAADFTWRVVENVRFGDTDRNGHVNNAVFATFLEIGRTGVLWAPEHRLGGEDIHYVLARLAIDFQAELLWPGRVEIATSIGAVGRSSITMRQALFQEARCAATAEAVVVRVDSATRRSAPLPEDVAAALRGRIGTA